MFIKMTDINFMKCISCFKNSKQYLKTNPNGISLFIYYLFKIFNKKETLKNNTVEYKYQHHDYNSDYT